MNDLPQYSHDIDQYFAPFKNHPAVQTAKKYVDERSVGFDAVMSMAVSISAPPELVPLTPFGHGVPDDRWGHESEEDFLPKLRDFYVSSHFADFFAKHESLYVVAEQRLQAVLTQLDAHWYSHFYDATGPIAFHFVIGMNNGGGFYGPRVRVPNGEYEIYAIVGAGPHDAAGKPEFPRDSVLPLIVHEFNHSFVNPAVDAHWLAFSGVEKVFDSVRYTLEKQAYATPKVMVYESIVRAAVIVYFRDHAESSQQLNRRIRAEELNGFFWMPRLVKVLEDCEAERSNGAGWTTCINRISRMYRRLAPIAVSKASSFRSSMARVKDMGPFLNHSDDVDPSITAIDVVLDKSISASSLPVTSRTRDHDYPVSAQSVTVFSNRVKIPVHLSPHTAYGMRILGAGFSTTRGRPAEDYIIDFRTN